MARKTTAELISPVETLDLPAHGVFPPYEIVDSTKKARRHIDRLRKSKLNGIDTEFDGPNLLSLQTSNGKDRVCVWAEYIIDDYVSVLNESKLVFHNFVADYFSMRNHGIELRDRHWADTMVMDWVNHTEEAYSHNLENAFAREFGIFTPHFKEMFNHYVPERKTPILLNLSEVRRIQPERFAAYGSLDPWKTIKLYWRLRDRLKKKNAADRFDSLWELYMWQERPFTEVLIRMRERGVSIDRKELLEIQKLVRKDKKKLERKWDRLANGVPIKGPGSKKGQLKLFYEDLRFPVIKKSKKTNVPSLDREVLEVLADRYGKRIAQLLADHRALDTHDNTFLTGILKGARKEVVCRRCLQKKDQCYGDISEEDPHRYKPVKLFVLRSDFNQLITTGRISSRKFYDLDDERVGANLQNIPIREEKDPHKIRRIFIARPERVYVVIDLSQVELRVAGHNSKAKTIIEAYNKGKDLHSITGMRVYELDVPWEEVKKNFPEERASGKNINFAMIFRASAYRIGAMMGVPREKRNEEGERIIKLFFEEYPELPEEWRRLLRLCRKYGYVKTISGRRRYIPLLKTVFKKLREHAERQAINTPVQGTAADIIKRAMVELEFGLLGYTESYVRKMQKRMGLIKKYVPIHKRMRQINSKIVLQIHDELILESPPKHADEALELADIALTKGYKLRVPIEAEGEKGPNWLAAK